MRLACYIAASLSAVTWCPDASASQITAVCKDISGIRLDDEAGSLKIDKDRLVGVSWAYTGDSETNDGTLILQNSRSAGSNPRVEKAPVKQMRSDHWTFVSVLSDGVWVHSLYPATGRLLVMQSTSGNTNALAGKMMSGKCEITTK